MSSHKTHEYSADSKFYYNNQTVIVTSYIKYIMLITGIIRRGKILPNI